MRWSLGAQHRDLCGRCNHKAHLALTPDLAQAPLRHVYNDADYSDAFGNVARRAPPGQQRPQHSAPQQAQRGAAANGAYDRCAALCARSQGWMGSHSCSGVRGVKGGPAGCQLALHTLGMRYLLACVTYSLTRQDCTTCTALLVLQGFSF